VSFLGLNFRTEILLSGFPGVEESDAGILADTLKKDFAKSGAGMGEIRKKLEHWIEFVNPYRRLRRAIDALLKELDGLGLDPEKDRIDDVWELAGEEERRARWKSTSERYTRGFALCFGIRSMLPVLAESFVNLLIFQLMRPELRTNLRLRENVFRQPIDIRIQSLPVNCVGFARQPDYGHVACRAYHSLVNERNDLLHGNIVVDKLKFNEVFFLGTVPVFKEYRSLWQRSLQIEMEAVGLGRVKKEVSVVEDLIEYLFSCLEDQVAATTRIVAAKYELGLRSDTQTLGVLFPNWLVDIRWGAQSAGEAADKQHGESAAARGEALRQRCQMGAGRAGEQARQQGQAPPSGPTVGGEKEEERPAGHPDGGACR
jgi:hypothetical protein